MPLIRRNLVKIAVTSKTLSNRPNFIKWLHERFDEVRLNIVSDKLKDERLIEFLRDCECVVLGTEPLHRDIVFSTNLDVVFKYGVGIDNIDFEACKEKNLPVLYKLGTNSDAVSEIAISYIIQLLRNQHLSFYSARNREWNKQTGKELRDARIGVLGFGHVGQKVHDKLYRLAPLTSISVNDIKESLCYRARYVEVEDLFSKSDIVTIHIDNGDLLNTNFVGERLLSLLPDGSYLVNTSRGSIMDYKALERHIDRLGGVALDVYPNEPEVPEFLINSNKAILSCHICGSSDTALGTGEDFIKESITEYLGR